MQYPGCRGSEEQRFWRKVRIDPVSGCWNWTAGKTSGYGSFTLSRKAGQTKSVMISAHVWAYEYLRGPIPKGLQVDHTCRNRACVNPEHLEAVPQKVNMFRGEKNACTKNAIKLYCKNGHPLFGPNLVWNVEPRGRFRRCLACRRANKRKWSRIARQKRRRSNAAES